MLVIWRRWRGGPDCAPGLDGRLFLRSVDQRQFVAAWPEMLAVAPEFFATIGMRLVGLGVLLGVAVALAAGKLVASLLYGLTARDPLTLTTAPLVLLLVGMAATLPAVRRAARVDPVVMLREE